jgi:hypothetical protein
VETGFPKNHDRTEDKKRGDHDPVSPDQIMIRARRIQASGRSFDSRMDDPSALICLSSPALKNILISF